MKLIVGFLFLTLISACTASDVPTQASVLGQSSNLDRLLVSMQQPGKIEFAKIPAADWQVPLSGLLNLEHEKAVQAGLEDRQEKIQIYVYVLKHPSEGYFLVDSGVSSDFQQDGGNPDVAFLMGKVMGLDKLHVLKSTKQLLAELGSPAGVLLTHIHFDHIMGLSDIKAGVPVYIGPGDTRFKTATHMASRGTTNRLLKTTSKLNEWQFDEAGIVDVLGDGSLWAIHAPGHTPGATAYLANTDQGPQLMLGDATHTRWGWDNGVEAGTYSENIALSARSLAKLKKLVELAPNIQVHPGHQP